MIQPAPSLAGRLGIRWLIRRDMREILDIERRACPAPWGEAEMLKRLRERNVIGMVCTLNGDTPAERIVGFFVYSLHRTYIEVLNFAVDPAHARRGVGRRMVAKLDAKLSPTRRTFLGIDCRETSLGFQQFLRATGWRATDVLRDWYDDTGEAAFRFKYEYSNAGMPYTAGFRAGMTADGGGEGRKVGA